MITLTKSLHAWGLEKFDATFRAEVPTLGNLLPLQEGLTAGSYAVEDSVEVMIISHATDHEFIRLKAGLFYKSLMPGCSCAGDPTVEDTQNEHVTVLVSINRKTAEAVFQLV